MQKLRAFSLVEVTMAIGIIGFALLALFALMPVGLTASREAANDTQTSLISQDVYARTQAAVNRGVYFDGTFARVPLTTGPTPPPTPVALPAPWIAAAAGAQTVTWFYDLNGGYRPEAMTGDFSSAYYRVDVKLGAGWDASSTIVPPPDPGLLRPVVVQLKWPVNQSTGAALNSNINKTFTFYIRKP